MLTNTSNKYAYQIFLDTHASIAFAAGRILDSKSGINVFPIQKSSTNGTVLWDVKLSSKRNYSVYNAIGRRSTVERRATLHIFAAAPNAFMFFLGQNSVGFGKCILYEYDFEQRNSCTYSQSISFTN